MKRVMNFAVATAFLAAMSAAPAVAQTSGTKPLPETTVTPDMAVPDQNTTSSTTPVDAHQAAIDAINGSKGASNELGTLSAVSKIKVVKVADVGGDATELQSAIDANKDHITGVQAAIKANPALSEKLEAEMVDLSAVVATHIEADGSVTIYTQ